MDLHNWPRRFELRNRTSRAHAELDASIGEWKNSGDYKQYLTRYASFRIPLERTIGDFDYATRFNGWEPQAIGAEIERDARDIEVSRTDDLPSSPIRTDCDALGVAYVLEGSSLGAKLLLRRAQELGFSSAKGAAHLAAQASSASWRQFLAILEDEKAVDIGEVATAAEATFAMALRAFKKDEL